MSNSNQSAKSGNMVSSEGTVENVVDLLLAQSTGEVSPLYEDNTINNQPAASGNFFNAEGEVENIVDVLLEKTSSEPLYEDKNNTLNTQSIKTGNMVASDGKVYNLVDLLKNVGGGSMPTVNVTNKSSSAISTGDKVWISPSGGSLEAIDFNTTTIGVPDRDIKGNVVISDSGIAVGFGSGSYIDVGELAMASASTWSIETEITTGNGVSSPQNVFSEAYATSSSCIQINNKKLQLNLRNPGSSSFLSYIISSATLSANTTYKIKAEFTGTAYNLYIDDVSVGTYSSTTKLETISWAIGACPTGSLTYPFGGSVDINKTSVKLNGTQVFPKSVTTINITEDCYTGQAKEDIAINASGAVAVVESPSPVQKGSFNASTQQLTLNYDYLVEKINSSTLSSESKASAISTLDGNDLEIDMTTDMLSAQGLENAPCWGFYDMTFGIQIVVDKQNPVNLKFFIGTESGTSMATYKGMADLFTALGQTMTPEQVEEAYGQYVVDENVCTVSGTLGNFSVEFN